MIPNPFFLDRAAFSPFLRVLPRIRGSCHAETDSCVGLCLQLLKPLPDGCQVRNSLDLAHARVAHDILALEIRAQPKERPLE